MKLNKGGRDREGGWESEVKEGKSGRGRGYTSTKYLKSLLPFVSNKCTISQLIKSYSKGREVGE